MSIKNFLHRQSEKACMCFKMRCVRTRDFMLNLLEIETTKQIFPANYFPLFKV